MIKQLVENCMNRIHATVWTVGSIPWRNSMQEAIEDACRKAYEAGRKSLSIDLHNEDT